MNSRVFQKNVLYLYVLLGALLISLFSLNTVFASESDDKIFYTDEIPFSMPANATIEFLDEHRFVVKNITLDAKSELEVKQGIKEVEQRDESKISFVPGKPEKGIKVYYSENGELASIRNADGSSFDKIRITNDNLSDDSIQTLASDDHALTKIASWGTSSTNTLYSERGTNKIWGYGNASCFTDTTGQANHKLVKGDCATQMKYDAIKNGTSVTVTVGSYKHVFTKWDVGSLPNAVVDIWKTGITYLGGSTGYNSFLKKCSMVHANNY